jgi:hypothetical protein
MNLAVPEERSQVIAIVVFAFGMFFSSQAIQMTLMPDQSVKKMVTLLLMGGI